MSRIPRSKPIWRCWVLIPILLQTAISFPYTTCRSSRALGRTFLSNSHIRHPKHNGDDDLSRNEKKNDEETMIQKIVSEQRRRALLQWSASSVLMGLGLVANSDAAQSAPLTLPWQRSGLYIVDTRDDIADEMLTVQVDTPIPDLSSEYALLETLPVKNPVFRTLDANLKTVSLLHKHEANATSDAVWTKVQKSTDTALQILTNKRANLEPVFNPEDTTAVAIIKGERGEILIEQLRDQFSILKNATNEKNMTLAFVTQKQALLTLGFLGELLVKEFPYRVPSRGKFSFLPRLIGRAQVTFRMKRAGAILGNFTIVADGYTAPITAGNFVDLCTRNFYTGLPVKSVTKKYGPISDQLPASVNILGSFNEGFFDPLTAKLRRLPLEIIRLEKGSGQPKLSYSTQGTPDVLLVCKTCLDNVAEDEASFTPAMTNSKPLVSFETRGLIAMDHPEKNPNGASSEFFGLTDEFSDGFKKRLDGQYAPFGFITNGYELFQELEADDIIDATFVDDFGQLNLVKIKESSFKEAAKGSESGGE